VKNFARRTSARTGQSHGAGNNGDRAVAIFPSRATGCESGNLCGPGHRPGPHLRIDHIRALFDSENPTRSGSLTGESFAAVIENHPRYPSLRSVRDAKLLARLDRVVEQKIKCVGLLQRFGFDEAGIALYQRAAITAFRAALPTN
jgi:hypothetical protein